MYNILKYHKTNKTVQCDCSSVAVIFFNLLMFSTVILHKRLKPVAFQLRLIKICRCFHHVNQYYQRCTYPGRTYSYLHVASRQDLNYSWISLSHTRIFRNLGIRSVFLNQKYILIAFSNHDLAYGTFLQVQIIRSAN